LALRAFCRTCAAAPSSRLAVELQAHRGRGAQPAGIGLVRQHAGHGQRRRGPAAARPRARRCRRRRCRPRRLTPARPPQAHWRLACRATAPAAAAPRTLAATNGKYRPAIHPRLAGTAAFAGGLRFAQRCRHAPRCRPARGLARIAAHSRARRGPMAQRVAVARCAPHRISPLYARHCVRQHQETPPCRRPAPSPLPAWPLWPWPA